MLASITDSMTGDTSWVAMLFYYNIMESCMYMYLTQEEEPGLWRRHGGGREE